MKIQKIITLASTPVRLRLLAMVRSLRAVGCELPVWVIPYGDEPESRFPLPDGCEWWAVPEILEWSRRSGAHPMTRKHQCFLEENYQYADTDIVFLRNPETVLAPHTGFVASCGHWRDPNHTLTEQSKTIFRRHSTTWQREVFNAGQFAVDRALFPDFAALRRVAEAPEHVETCLYPIGDQPGINLLRLLSGVPIRNLTLLPDAMESTWAGDYPEEGYATYWRDESARPYLIHWAGVPMHAERPINELFYSYLTPEELAQWHAEVQAKAQHPENWKGRLRRYKGRTRRAWDALVDS